MGLPWPPTWEAGQRCELCIDVIFGGLTPIFVYAFAQNLVQCPGAPPGMPDPNRVIRMTQHPLFPCLWMAFYDEGIYQYQYSYFFAGGTSQMHIDDVSGMPIFKNTIFAQCIDHFTNEWHCDDLETPGFSGGTVDCFW